MVRKNDHCANILLRASLVMRVYRHSRILFPWKSVARSDGASSFRRSFGKEKLDRRSRSRYPGPYLMRTWLKWLLRSYSGNDEHSMHLFSPLVTFGPESSSIVFIAGLLSGRNPLSCTEFGEWCSSNQFQKRVEMTPSIMSVKSHDQHSSMCRAFACTCMLHHLPTLFLRRPDFGCARFGSR